METQKIQLTSRESQLRFLLLDAARYIDESKEVKDKIELRWAGGWVRDKLLGLQSHDIDTAINAMTGYRFCEKMQDYLKDEENMKKHSLTATDMGSLHKILANPDKSKHLETATTRLYEFDLDFVNLRKETYSEDSRTPQMEFGTAEEDASRRDATINALFYNLHTDLVEDFTGGLEDIRAKRIRTPLEPFTTFKDDPLRVLRLIRFSSRLGFPIDPESQASMSNPAVMETLKIKITRERIGVELEKMLKGNSSLHPQVQTVLTIPGNNPRGAMQLIDQLGLYPIIFTDPTTNSTPVPDSSHWHVIYNCLALLESNKTPGSIYQSLIRSEDAKYLAWILAALTPLTATPNPENVGGKLPFPYATNVAREGIKADNKICSHVTGAFRNYRDIINLKDAIKRKDSFVTERDTLGMMIRKWDSLGGQWRVQVLFALFVESLQQADVAGYDTLFAEWQRFIDHLDSMYLMEAASIKSIVDGKRLQRELNAGPGPPWWVKDALEVCMAWQLRNRELVEKDPEKARCDAIEEVRRRKAELKIPVKSM